MTVFRLPPFLVLLSIVSMAVSPISLHIFGQDLNIRLSHYSIPFCDQNKKAVEDKG